MRTSRSKVISAAVGLVVLAGCVTLQPTLLPTAAPAETSGYVAGFFARTDAFGHGTGAGFGLVLRNADTAAEYVIPFDAKERTDDDKEAHAVMIEVPPGSYAVTAWTSYVTSTRALATRKDVPADHALSRPFQVTAGRVVILGRFSADSYSTGTARHFSVQPRAIPEVVAQSALAQAFPAFASAPMSCLVCASTATTPRFDAAPRPSSLQLRPPTLDAPKRR